MAGWNLDLGDARAVGAMIDAAALDAAPVDERPGLSARVELHEATGDHDADLALIGWMDRPALRRFERVLDGLASNGVRRLAVDCGRLRHVDYVLVPRLADALARFEIRSGTFALIGLSAHLRDLFRLAGCEAWLRSAASAAALAAPPGSERETAP